MDPEKGLTPRTAVALETAVIKTSYKNKWGFTRWSDFANLQKLDYFVLFSHLQNQGVNERGLYLFRLAWETRDISERKAKIDAESWKIQKAIAEGIVSWFGGRLFIKLGLRLVSLNKLKSLFNDASIKGWSVVNEFLNRQKREIYYFIAELYKKNPAKWEKLIRTGDQFKDYTKEVQMFVEKILDELKKIHN